jgi:hypothetical protein
VRHIVIKLGYKHNTNLHTSYESLPINHIELVLRLDSLQSLEPQLEYMNALIGTDTKENANFVMFRFMTTNPEEKLPPIDGYVEYEGDPRKDTLQRDSKIVLAIQKELVDEKRTLLQTSAGQKIRKTKES